MIIYYKQISEGYEDQNRFEIMQKVGPVSYTHLLSPVLLPRSNSTGRLK